MYICINLHTLPAFCHEIYFYIKTYLQNNQCEINISRSTATSRRHVALAARRSYAEPLSRCRHDGERDTDGCVRKPAAVAPFVWYAFVDEYDKVPCFGYGHNMLSRSFSRRRGE